MAIDAVPYPEPKSVTLDTSGNGSITWQNGRPTVVKTVHRITVTSPAANGVVSVYQDGALLTSRSLALYVAADGPLTLYPGQSVEVRVTGGQASTLIAATMHSSDEAMP